MSEKKALIIAWSFGIGLTLAGVACFGHYVFVVARGTTPQNELTLAEGVPLGVWESVGSRGRYLYFTVAGHATNYSDGDAKYNEIAAAVRLGVPVRIWVSTKREAVFPRKAWVPLYIFDIGDRRILTYEEVAAKKGKNAFAPLILAGVLLSPGVFLLYAAIRGTWGAPATPAQPANTPPSGTYDPRSPKEAATLVIWTTVFVSALCYGTPVWLFCFDARTREKQAVAFGPDIFGLPTTLVLVLVHTVLFLPMPWVFWHLARILCEFEGTRPGIVSVITTGLRRPHLRRSLIVTILGFAYLGFVGFGWFAYATSPGK